MAFTSDLQTVMVGSAALVVGTVSTGGEPRAHRAWSVVVVDPDERRIRFVMSSHDPDLVEHLEAGAVSLTGADVKTYQSMQLKGRVVSVDALTAADLERTREQCDALLEVIHDTDGIALELLHRILPTQMIAVEMIVEETFDQTPGPKAGAQLGAAPARTPQSSGSEPA